MNRDLIEFYEEQKIKIQREIDELLEVGKKSPKRINRLVEIDFILAGLNAEKEEKKLKNYIRNLKCRLMQEGINIDE